MELGLLAAFMVITILVMVGMLAIFRRWLQRRREIEVQRGQHGS